MLSFELSQTIIGSPQAVFPYFADLLTFGRVHPIIYKVEPNGKDGEYLMYERVKLLGFIPYSFVYPGKVTETVPFERIVIEAKPPHGLRLHIVVTLTATADNKTTIHELVAVEGGWLQVRALRYFILKCHREIAKTIEQELNAQK